MLISLIVPCYNEEEALPFLYDALCDVRSKMSDREFEFIFVNDGSKDNTTKVIKDLASKDEDEKTLNYYMANVDKKI